MQGCFQVGDVTLTSDLINVSFRRFKHSARHGPQSLQVRGECLEGSLIHPAAFLREFIQVRGPVQGILFGYPDGSPMLRGEFDVSLKRLLSFCGYQSSSFKGHSFRIGAATAAALRGESDAQIRAAQMLLGSISELLKRLGRGGVVTCLWVTSWRNGPTCL